MKYNVIAIIFLAAGLFWISIVMLGEGAPLLITPGLASIITAIMLFGIWGAKYAKILAIATAIYNLILLIYQLIAAIILLEINPGLTGIFITIGYLIGTLFFIAILILGYSKSENLLKSTFQSSEENKKNRN